MTYGRSTYNSEIVPHGSIRAPEIWADTREEMEETYKYTTVVPGTDSMAEWRSWAGTSDHIVYQPSNMDHWLDDFELVEYNTLQFIRSGINTNGLIFKIRKCDTHIPEKDLRFLYVFNSDDEYVAFCKKVKVKYTSTLDANYRSMNRATFMWEVYNFSYTKLFVRDNRGEGGYYDPDGRIGRRNGGTGYHAMDNYMMTTFIPYRYFHWCADFDRWDSSRVTRANRFAWLTAEGEDRNFRAGGAFGSPDESLTESEYEAGEFTYSHNPIVKFMSRSDSNDIIRGVAQESRRSNSRFEPAGDAYVDATSTPKLRRPFGRNNPNRYGETSRYAGKENRIVKEIYSPFLRRHYTINVSSQPTDNNGRVDCRSRNRFTNMLDRNDIPFGDLLTMLCTKISGKIKYDYHILSRVSEMNTDSNWSDNMDRLICNSRFNYIPEVDDDAFLLDPSDVLYMKPRKVDPSAFTTSYTMAREEGAGDRCDIDTFCHRTITRPTPRTDRQRTATTYRVIHLEYHPECFMYDSAETEQFDCGHSHVGPNYLSYAREERAIELPVWDGLCDTHTIRQEAPVSNV